ncbi:MAG: SRPBCC family protein [Candidatus Neomarinimicrobiota bacterium]
MKILKTALMVIFIGILVYIIIGLLTPPISKEVVIQLAQPAETIFSKLTDQSNMIKWVPGLKSVTQASGKPNTVGSVSKFIFERDSVEIPILVRIDDLSDNESINLTLIHDKLIAEVQLKIIPEPDGSKLDVSYKIDGNSLLARSVMPFIKPLIEKYSDMDIEEIKTLLKEQRPDS